MNTNTEHLLPLYSHLSDNPAHIIVNDPIQMFHNWSLLDCISFYNNQIASKIIHGATPFACKVVLTVGSETISERALTYFNAIIEYFSSTYKIPINNFYLSVDCLDCDTNREIFNKYSIWNSNIIFTKTLQESQRQFQDEPVIDYTPRIKPYKFLFYNKACREHRYALAYRMAQEGLTDSGIWSADWDLDLPNHSMYLYPIFMKGEKSNIQHLFPKTLNYNYEYFKPDVAHIESTYFSIITESVYTTDHHGLPPGTVNLGVPGNIFITEKTWRTIMSYHPFILVAPTNTLLELKKLGFKTFTPWINESYDGEQDDQKRLQKIYSEIKRLSELSDNKWKTLQEEMLPILKHNRARLIQMISPEYYIHNPDKKVDLLRI